MHLYTVVVASIALCAALLAPASAKPTALSKIPDDISPNVRRSLKRLPADKYKLYPRDVGRNAHNRRRAADLSGVQTSCRTDNCLAITFDDGPYEWEGKLRHLFERDGEQRTTFFVNGNNWRCIYSDESVKKLRHSYEKGHQICSHTWSHPDLSTLNNTQLDTQVQLVEDALWKIIGAVPACIRAPYGSIRDEQVRHLNDRWGLVVVGWNFDSNDANGYTPEQSINVYRGIHPANKPIVLNHETHQSTVDTVIPEALKIMRQNGFSGSQTTAATIGYRPYKVTGPYQDRDASWTCDDKLQAGQA